MRLSWAETHTFLDMLRRLLTVHPLTIETFETGLALAERYRLTIHDAMIVSAAIEADCDVLLSENMHDGLIVETKLHIINPSLTNAS